MDWESVVESLMVVGVFVAGMIVGALVMADQHRHDASRLSDAHRDPYGNDNGDGGKK